MAGSPVVVTSVPHSLSVLYVCGTHYEVGFETGRIFKSNIPTYCNQSSTLNDVLLPYYCTDEGRAVYDEFWAAMKEVYPQYEDELRGIADSSGVDCHKLFLMHIGPEMLGLLGKQANAGCSDVMLNYLDCDGKQRSLAAHNEDGDRLIASLAYVVHAHIKPDPNLYPCLPEERFVSYSYPGRLVGNCMSANCHGVTWSANILFPKRVARKKTAFYTMTRALASAHSLEHAQSIIADDPLGCAYGFSLNLAQRQRHPGEISMMNIEVAPRTDTIPLAPHIKKLPVSADLVRGFAAHFNMYQRMTEVEQHTDQSTMQRERTLYDNGELPRDVPSILAFLGNREHPVYPVYRNATPPDTMTTIATGIFDLLEGTFGIHVDNPQNGADPVVSFPVMQRPQSSPVATESVKEDM